MIHITTNPTFKNEKEYIFDVIFKHWLGIPYSIHYEQCTNYEIQLPNGAQFTVPDIFFQMNESKWGQIEELQKIVDYTKSMENQENINFFNKVSSELDVFGLTFYILTCYEEICLCAKDKFDRFDHTQGILFKRGLLETPVVNIYLEKLWAKLQKNCPSLKRKERSFRFEVSHDVDHPFLYFFSGVNRLIKSSGKALIKEKNIFKCIKQPFLFAAVKNKKVQYDPHYNFDWIMEQSEKANLISTFYFLSGNTSSYDGDYDIDNPYIIDIIEKIHKRGHKIGLHGSFNTFNHPSQMRKDYDALSSVMHQIDPLFKLSLSRQHYLRFDSKQTPQILNSVGIKRDSTLSHAGHVGFRSGTCYEYPMYDLEKRQPLNIWQQPLIVMEGTLFYYMKLGIEESLQRIKTLAQTCKKYNGTFTLLWHNSEFETNAKKEAYKIALFQ